MSETQAINDLARLLYDLLPGNPHPFASQAISFRGVAQEFGLGAFWLGGSKLPSITHLLEQVLANRREKFCDLIVQVVRRAITYRNSKNSPLMREDVVELNELVKRIGFKIPELWDGSFLETLPRIQPKEDSKDATLAQQVAGLRAELVALTSMKPQPRGFAFEKFLNGMFSTFGLEPRLPFRIRGEQIDGSFQLDSDTYLLEACFCPSKVLSLLPLDSA